jgi:hypothetical protein
LLNLGEHSNTVISLNSNPLNHNYYCKYTYHPAPTTQSSAFCRTVYLRVS